MNQTVTRITNTIRKCGGIVGGKFKQVAPDSYEFTITGELISGADYREILSGFTNRSRGLTPEEIKRNRVRAKANGADE